MTEDASSSRSWFQNLRSIVFRREPSLRDQIEDAIEDAEDGTAPAHGDLSAIEREMLLNLLHFGERTVGDIAVPRSELMGRNQSHSRAEVGDNGKCSQAQVRGGGGRCLFRVFQAIGRNPCRRLLQ